MRTAVVLLVFCAFACLASATSIRKSHLQSNSTMEHKVFTRKDFGSTCTQLTLTSGTILAGYCKNIRGDWEYTTLDLNPCFSNNNGVFSCGGQYAASAQNPKLSGTTLTAALRKMDGSWVTNSAELNNFITNRNGRLVCDCGW